MSSVIPRHDLLEYLLYFPVGCRTKKRWSIISTKYQDQNLYVPYQKPLRLTLKYIYCGYNLSAVKFDTTTRPIKRTYLIRDNTKAVVPGIVSACELCQLKLCDLPWGHPETLQVGEGRDGKN